MLEQLQFFIGLCWWVVPMPVVISVPSRLQQNLGHLVRQLVACADYWQVPYPVPAGLPDCNGCLVGTTYYLALPSPSFQQHFVHLSKCETHHLLPQHRVDLWYTFLLEEQVDKTANTTRVCMAHLGRYTPSQAHWAPWHCEISTCRAKQNSPAKISCL